MCICGANATVSIVVVAIWSIIQSVCYVAVSAMGILAHNCQYDMTKSKASYLMYLYYFRNSACGVVNLEFLGIPSPIMPVLPEITVAAQRTNTLLMISLCLTLVWLLTSVMLFMASCCSCVGRRGHCGLYYPWIFTTGTIIVFDVVATIYFAIDCMNNQTVVDALNFLEVGNIEEIKPLFDGFGSIFLMIPSLIMALVASKLAIVWFINVIFFFIIIRVATKSWKDDKKIKSDPRKQIDSYDQQQSKQSSSKDEIEQQPQWINNNDNEINPIASRYLDPVPQHPSQINDYTRPRMSINKTNYQPPAFNYNHVEEDVNQRRNSNLIQRDPRSLENARQTIEPLQENASFDERRTSVNVTKPAQQPSVDNYIDQKFSYLNNSKPYDPASYQSSPKQNENYNPPPELRSQLPWSYFKSRDDVNAPRKKLNSYVPEDELPPVPVPDYTMHFPKAQRPMAHHMTSDRSSSSDEGKWSGPEQKY